MVVKAGLSFSPSKKRAVAPAKPRITRRRNLQNEQDGSVQKTDVISTFRILPEPWPRMFLKFKDAFESFGFSNQIWSFIGRESSKAVCCLCPEPTEAVSVKVIFLCSGCGVEDVGNKSYVLCDSCGKPWSSLIHYFYCKDHTEPLREDSQNV